METIRKLWAVYDTAKDVVRLLPPRPKKIDADCALARQRKRALGRLRTAVKRAGESDPKCRPQASPHARWARRRRTKRKRFIVDRYGRRKLMGDPIKRRVAPKRRRAHSGDVVRGHGTRPSRKTFKRPRTGPYAISGGGGGSDRRVAPKRRRHSGDEIRGHGSMPRVVAKRYKLVPDRRDRKKRGLRDRPVAGKRCRRVR